MPAALQQQGGAHLATPPRLSSAAALATSAQQPLPSPLRHQHNLVQSAQGVQTVSDVAIEGKREADASPELAPQHTLQRAAEILSSPLRVAKTVFDRLCSPAARSSAARADDSAVIAEPVAVGAAAHQPTDSGHAAHAHADSMAKAGTPSGQHGSGVPIAGALSQPTASSVDTGGDARMRSAYKQAQAGADACGAGHALAQPAADCAAKLVQLSGNEAAPADQYSVRKAVRDKHEADLQQQEAHFHAQLTALQERVEELEAERESFQAQQLMVQIVLCIACAGM